MLGVSGLQNPLPTGSPSWGSRIGRAKAFCAQAPAMPPEPARPLSAEAPSHRRPKTSFWQLHSAKGKSPRAANNSPIAPWLRKATQALLDPGPLLSRGQSGEGLPLATWALLLCWGTLAPNPTSPPRRTPGEWVSGAGDHQQSSRAQGAKGSPSPLCWGSWRPKPTPHGFSILGKQDWAREALLRPGRSHAP